MLKLSNSNSGAYNYRLQDTSSTPNILMSWFRQADINEIRRPSERCSGINAIRRGAVRCAYSDDDAPRPGRHATKNILAAGRRRLAQEIPAFRTREDVKSGRSLQ